MKMWFWKLEYYLMCVFVLSLGHMFIVIYYLRGKEPHADTPDGI